MLKYARGTFVPPWYKATTPDTNELNTAGITLGFTLGVALWIATKAFKQTRAIWMRTHRVTAYMLLIWSEWIACLVIAIVSWFFVNGFIQLSFEYLFCMIVVWSIQVQALMQIIINRISILMDVRAHGTRLKWAVFIIILLINVSVFCIWIPAKLQISKTFVHVNEIWDRIEKGLFLLVDLGLNLTFIYLVRSRLVSRGLTKYNVLFKFNLWMIFFSMSLDVLVIGILSLQYAYDYCIFQSLIYIVKLHIELKMADLITLVAAASHEMEPYVSRNNENPPINGHDQMQELAI